MSSSAPTILGFETTFDTCHVALYYNGALCSSSFQAQQQHGRYLLPEIHHLLEMTGCGKKSIQYIAFGIGPGSFTGIRIATSVAHALSIPLQARLLPISSLEQLAYYCAGLHQRRKCKPIHFATFIHARRDQFYGAIYQLMADMLSPVSPPRLLSLEQMQAYVAPYPHLYPITLDTPEAASIISEFETLVFAPLLDPQALIACAQDKILTPATDFHDTLPLYINPIHAKPLSQQGKIFRESL